MNRRDALERVALILGGTVIGGAVFLQGCKNTTEKAASFFLSQDQIAFLDEVFRPQLNLIFYTLYQRSCFP